jgi:hypothetical protein
MAQNPNPKTQNSSRNYDAQIGRWLQPDPLMQHPSPYLAMSNNPVSFTDPLGLWDLAEFVVTAKRLYPNWSDFNNVTDPFDRASIQADLVYDNGGKYRKNGEAYGEKAARYNDNLENWTKSLNNSNWRSKANTGFGAIAAANGAKTELMDYAVRSNYKSAKTWSEFNKLRPSQKAWRTTNTLGKSGESYLKGAKVLSKAVFAVTVINSGINALGAVVQNDPNKIGVVGKAALDVTMGYVGFLGPIGFGVSATYFILDSAGAFNSWSQPERK